MRAPVSLDEMVERASLTSEGAELLRGIGARAQPFIVYSLPRNAGKSTLMEAILAHAPAGVPRRDFLGTEEQARDLAAAPDKGYLVVAEMGHRGRPGYLAGDEVVRAFGLAGQGYSLASSLHADNLAAALAVLADNGISGPDVAAVPYFVKVQPLGDPMDTGTRRVVESVELVEAGTEGQIRATPLYSAPAGGLSPQT